MRCFFSLRCLVLPVFLRGCNKTLPKPSGSAAGADFVVRAALAALRLGVDLPVAERAGGGAPSGSKK